MTNFYQSPSDKARFDVLLKVLLSDAPNLSLFGNDAVALAPSCRKLSKRILPQPPSQ